MKAESKSLPIRLHCGGGCLLPTPTPTYPVRLEDSAQKGSDNGGGNARQVTCVSQKLLEIK